MAIMAYLPRNKWRVCTRCGGTGERLESQDLHRSEGWVPCGCHKGWITYDSVDLAEYRLRAATGNLADSEGNLKPPHVSNI